MIYLKPPTEDEKAEYWENIKLIAILASQTN